MSEVMEYPSGLTIKYKYDKKDNLVEKKRVVDGEVVKTVNNEYDDENRLISSNDKTYSYDKDGNQVQAGETSFDYMTSFVNGKNVKRLKSVYDSNEHVASYSYTLEGQRTGKYLHDGDSKISYHYNGRNVQYEQWSNGRTVRYTHPIEGGSSCSSCGCGGSSGVFTDHPISIEVNGTKYYYLYNGQGSVTELINADEEVVNKYRYTPFGSPRLKVESVYNPYEYTGRRLDEETGQYYYRARMYSTEQCRFTTQDPAGIKQGPNMYAYVDNNPVNHRDPSGMVDTGGAEPLPGPGEEKINGGGGGEYDLSTCPGSPLFDSYWDCIGDDRDLIPDEDCTAVCYETGYVQGDGECHLTQAYWDCVSGPVTVTSSIISIVGGCVAACVFFPPCVGGCLATAGITATAVFVGCLANPGAVECN